MTYESLTLALMAQHGVVPLTAFSSLVKVGKAPVGLQDKTTKNVEDMNMN